MYKSIGLEVTLAALSRKLHKLNNSVYTVLYYKGIAKGHILDKYFEIK